jgi:hypothetical protein
LPPLLFRRQRRLHPGQGGRSPSQRFQPTTVDDPLLRAARLKFFGSREMNWLAFNSANDITLPNSTRGGVNFFMYPQAGPEAGGLDSLDPDTFRYTMSAKEVAS